MLFDPNDTRPVAVVLCGPPGCGKTTFRQRKLPKWGLVSSDAILMDIAKKRELTYTQAFESYINHASSVFLDALATYTMFQRPIILDRTHTTVESRAITLSRLKGYRTIAVYFPAMENEQLISRIAEREFQTGQGVPSHVVKEMNARYKYPTIEEGFDAVVSANEFVT